MCVSSKVAEQRRCASVCSSRWTHEKAGKKSRGTISRRDRSRYNLDPSLPLYGMLWGIWRIQSRKPVLRACRWYGSTAATWATTYRSGIYLRLERSRSWTVVGIDLTDHTDHLSVVCNLIVTSINRKRAAHYVTVQIHPIPEQPGLFHLSRQPSCGRCRNLSRNIDTFSPRYYNQINQVPKGLNRSFPLSSRRHLGFSCVWDRFFFLVETLLRQLCVILRSRVTRVVLRVVPYSCVQNALATYECIYVRYSSASWEIFILAPKNVRYAVVLRYYFR